MKNAALAAQLKALRVLGFDSVNAAIDAATSYIVSLESVPPVTSGATDAPADVTFLLNENAALRHDLGKLQDEIVAMLNPPVLGTASISTASAP